MPPACSVRSWTVAPTRSRSAGSASASSTWRGCRSPRSRSPTSAEGWGLTTTADLGLHLWDLVWEAGRDVGLVAAGRRAFETLRLEAGYPAAGVDETAEHAPGPAGSPDSLVRPRLRATSPPGCSCGSSWTAS